MYTQITVYITVEQKAFLDNRPKVIAGEKQPSASALIRNFLGTLMENDSNGNPTN